MRSKPNTKSSTSRDMTMRISSPFFHVLDDFNKHIMQCTYLLGQVTGHWECLLWRLWLQGLQGQTSSRSPPLAWLRLYRPYRGVHHRCDRGYTDCLWARGWAVKFAVHVVHVVNWIYNPKVVSSNPTRDTIGKVSENHFLGSTQAMWGNLGRWSAYHPSKHERQAFLPFRSER